MGWLPEDVLPSSVLINLYNERQEGEELLTAPLFFLPKLKQLKQAEQNTYAHLETKSILIHTQVSNLNRCIKQTNQNFSPDLHILHLILKT